MTRADAVLRCLWFTKGLGRGGVERLLLDMYPLVDADRFEVDVAYVLPWKDNYHQGLADAGARVHCLGSSRSGDPSWILRLNRLLRENRYDVVHTHAPVPGVWARLSSLGRGAPAIIHTEHNMWDRYRRPTRLANAITYARNDAVIAVSETVAATIDPPRLPGSNPPPVSTVHHGTVLGSVAWYPDDERLRRRSTLGLPTDSFLIGKVGNFTPKKDHRNLLTALAADGPISNAHLVLIGLGPLEDELRLAVTELGIGNRVTFLGSRDDVFEILPLLDLFCLSSEFEGFPIALVEAMATGLPCVATAAGGVPEILDDGANGLVVPPKNSRLLADAVNRMMTDTDLAQRCGTAAKVAAEKLDLRNAVRDLEELYLAAHGRR